MIKALVTPGAYTSGNIPLTLSADTNRKYSLANNVVSIKTDKLSNVKANVILTATAAGLITLQAYADGIAIPGALATVTAEIGSTYTLHVNDVVQTEFTVPATLVGITLALSGACTLVGGDVILENAR